MRSASTFITFLAVLFSIFQITPKLARAGSVDVAQSTLLNADVTAVLGDPASPADSKESHDFGDVLKPDATAQASASVPIETGAFTGSGASEVHLSASDDGFVLAGKSSASLTGTSPLAGEVRSTARFDLTFTIEDGFRASPEFSANIDKLVLRDEKVTLVIDRTGGSESIFSKTFDDSFGGSLDPVGAGSYHLQLITGSIATAKGIAGETGSANFQLSLAASPVTEPPPPTIVLPASLSSGATLLAGAWLLRRRVASSLAL